LQGIAYIVPFTLGHIILQRDAAASICSKRASVWGRTAISGAAALGLAETVSRKEDTSNTSICRPRLMTTERSTKFFSSRTLPARIFGDELKVFVV
jgi:hypothetical protein